MPQVLQWDSQSSRTAAKKGQAQGQVGVTLPELPELEEAVIGASFSSTLPGVSD
jgi:hypothetical protein